MKRRGQKLFARIVTLLMACLLVPVFAMVASADEPETTPTAAECYLHGDVNGDGYVDSRDAIKTLYHSMLKDAVNQDCDFNEDGEVTAEDAIYLLYASLDIVEGYELKGTVHVYREPEWLWNQGTAIMVRSCACGQDNLSVEAEVSEVEASSATCTADGFVTYEATVSVDGQVYTDRKTVTIAATGHALEGELTCTSGIVCTNADCDYVVEPLNHDWILDAENSSDATCQSGAVQAYKCARECGETKSVITSEAGEHSYIASERVAGCAHTKVFTCAYCQDTYDGETVNNHTYTATMTKEANCMEMGVKTFVCAACGDSYAEDMACNGIHIWDAGTTTADLTTYRCTVDGCNETKSAAVYKEQTEAAVSTDVLANSELQLKDATVSLDEAVLNQVSEQEEITIKVEPAADMPAMDAALAAQITGTVYDFGMYAGEEEIKNFDGLVTISIPYTLQDGDDPDCIDVWYIDDNGVVTVVEGAYSNGQVTFSTNHFSYYTVTRLTAEQRCATYGHAMVEKYKAATCTSDGYDVAFCQRCPYEEKNEILTKLGHNLVDTGKAATCEEAGSVSKSCDRDGCNYAEIATLEALGHAWYLSDEEEASCTKNGVQTFACSVCEDSYTAELPKLPHSYEAVVTANTCTEKGYTTWTCSVCGDSYTGEETAAKGHSYQATWTWAEDYSSATVTLTCEHDTAHSQTLEAVVSSVVKGASCTAKGEVTYTAAVSYNMQQFTDTKTVELAVKGHTPGEAWESNANKHYHVCQVCGQQLDVVEHVWGETQVQNAPSCIYNGTGVIPCTICGYEQSVNVPATGEHNMVNGSCSVCGFRDSNCSHLRTYESKLDVSEYGVCEGWDVRAFTCDCGEYGYVEIHWLGCNFTEETYRDETTEEGYEYTVWVRSCEDCGLVYEYAWYPKMVDSEKCLTGYVDYVKLIGGDGNVIVDSEFVSPFMQMYHTSNRVGEAVDMTQYGLCGGELLTYQCHCGQFTHHYIENAACEWVDDEENSTEQVRIRFCAVCGTTETYAYVDFVEENCTWKDTRKYTYTNGDKTFSYMSTIGDVMHEFRTTEYEMYGDSCEDGLYIAQICDGCGMTNERFVKYHEHILWTDMDLSEYDICYDTFRTYVCACGDFTSAQMMSEDKWCQMDYVGVDEATGVETWQCPECGLIHETFDTYGEKDENCERSIEHHHTYKTAEGETIASHIEKGMDVEHNYVTTWELAVPGGSCEDGVTETRTCMDCGGSYSNTYDYHSCHQLERYDAADYGMCGGTIFVYSCVCGRDAWVEWQECYCSWDHVEFERISSTHYISTEYCTQCDTYREEEYQKEYWEDSCKVTATRTYTYIKDDATLLTVSVAPTDDEHRAIYTFDERSVCGGEGIVYYSCAQCGETGEIEYRSEGHSMWVTARKELIPEGTLCGGMDLITLQCSCGEEKGTGIFWFGGECNFQDQWDEEGNHRYACVACGAEETNTSEGHYVSDDSCEWIDEYFHTISMDGKVVVTYTSSGTWERHDDRCTFEILGETCEDGYYIHRTCARCGYQSEPQYSTEDCAWWNGERVVYNGEGLCGSIRVNQYVHPFGDIHEEIEMACAWNWYWDDEKNTSCAACAACGGTVDHYTESGYASDDSCLWENREYYTCYDQAGNELVTFDRTQTTKNHRWAHYFEMLGKTCEEGYYLRGNCSRCDAVYKDNELRTSCQHYITGETVILDSEAVCGKLIKLVEETPCGLRNERVTEECDWNWMYLEELQQECGVCSQCGIIRSYTGEGAVDPENSCIYVENGNYVFYDQNFNELVSCECVEYRSNHNYVYTYAPYGESCEEGYTVTGTCTRCGVQNSVEAYGSHETRMTVYYDMSEYGLCGGPFEYYSCACGKETYWYDSTAPGNWEPTGEYDEDGAEEYYCQQYDAYRYHRSSTETDRANCKRYETLYEKFVRNGETVLEFTWYTSDESHVYQMESYTGNCGEGFEARMVCKFCGDAVYEGHGPHGTVTMEYRDLSELDGCCGGELYFVSCPCGEETGINWNLTGHSMVSDSWNETVDGLDHNFEKQTCETCELNTLRETWRIWNKETCRGIEHQNFTVSYGDEELASCHNEWDYVHHDYSDAYSLLEGSESCDDGILVTQTCKTCGYQDTYESSGHHTSLQESIDLTQYGAVCKTTLDKYNCACGANLYCELGGEAKCDMDQTVEEEHVYQYTSKGYVGLWSYYTDMTCAVTDPQCGFKLYHARYWDINPDTCMATEYEEWTCFDGEDVIFLVNAPTGERHAFHDYSETSVSETNEDGSCVSGTRYTCVVCQSTCEQMSRYDADGRYIGNDYHAVNTLDNGENREWIQQSEYIHITDYPVHSREYTKYVYADGSEYWYENTYTYSVDPCIRYQTYQDSTGYTGSSETPHSNCGGTSEWIQDCTCTQAGILEFVTECLICGAETDRHTENRDPYGHEWYPSEIEEGEDHYYCARCGLKNSNGADGSIVLEDLSDYRNGDEYVAGYWNRGNVDYTVVFSLITLDADGNEVMTQLDVNVYEYDGAVAKAINRDEAYAAACEALGVETLDGVNGSDYFFRIIFVSNESGEALDYALTFIPEQY